MHGRKRFRLRFWCDGWILLWSFNSEEKDVIRKPCNLRTGLLSNTRWDIERTEHMKYRSALLVTVPLCVHYLHIAYYLGITKPRTQSPDPQKTSKSSWKSLSWLNPCLDPSLVPLQLINIIFILSWHTTRLIPKVKGFIRVVFYLLSFCRFHTRRTSLDSRAKREKKYKRSRSFLGASRCSGNGSSLTALIDAIANENGDKGSEYNCIAFKLKKLAPYYIESRYISFFAEDKRKERVNILSKNFTKPSNVCATPAINEPIAEKKALMRPRIVLRIDWRRATMEERVAPMVLKMEAKRLERDSMRDGIVAASDIVLGW